MRVPDGFDHAGNKMGSSGLSSLTPLQERGGLDDTGITTVLVHLYESGTISGSSRCFRRTEG
jgi:hypothetical protein